MVSASAVGAEIVAETSAATATVGTVSVAEPATVAFWLNASEFASASAVSVAVASAVLKMALLLSAQVAAALSNVQASASPQFVSVPRHV